MPATAPQLYPNYYQPYYQQAGQNNVPYVAGNNVNQAAANQRATVESQGNQFEVSDEDLAQQYQQQQAGTQQYLNPLEETLASGGGGYTPGEASQIELTPQQQQNIVTNAGISAGQGNAAAVSGAERATAAAGGSPAALETYRARAAQSQAANAGQAETGASVAAQQAESAGAQAVGGARMAQQNQGLGYLGNLQAQQGGQQSTEQGLAQGAYGTETSGTGQGVNSQISAAGVPTSTDKAIGAIAGAAGSLLADGHPAYVDEDDGGQDAVVGENGLEAVIENAPKAVLRGASDPVRSHTTFMDDGGFGTTPTTPPGTSGMPSWLQSYLANATKPVTDTQKTQGSPPAWNAATPYSQLGSAIGSVARPLVHRAVTPTTPPSVPPISAAATLPGSPEMAAPPAPEYVPPADTPDIPMAADGRPSYVMMAGGRMGSGFHWSDRAPAMPQTPHMEERAGYQPLAYKPKPMLADGAVPVGDQPPTQQAARPEKASMKPSVGPMKTPVAGKGALPAPHMADGSIAMPQSAPVDPAAINDPEAAQGPSVQPRNGMQVGGAKVFGKPTLVHLEKADMVVPLGYRARAKVRPSAALPALKRRSSIYRAA